MLAAQPGTGSHPCAGDEDGCRTERGTQRVRASGMVRVTEALVPFHGTDRVGVCATKGVVMKGKVDPDQAKLSIGDGSTEPDSDGTI
jgi:hypothetical protein